MWANILISTMILVGLQAISITVSSDLQKCMIVSSNDQEQYLKIDLLFEMFANQKIQEGYRVVLHNTQTHSEQAFQVYKGIFRKQFKLTQNVVYRLCFKIVLTQFRSITKAIEYSAGIKHRFSAADTHIQIPDKLLKSKDLSETYKFLTKAKELMDRVKAQDQRMKEEESRAFEGRRGSMSTFEVITIGEIVAICLLGGYQYFKLRTIINQKQRGE